MSTIDPTSPATLQLVGLLAARYGGLMLIAPVFSARTFPIMVRSALLVVLTLLTLPAAHAWAEQPVQLTPVTLLAETLTGFALGFAAALVVAGAEIAGDLLGTQSGLAGATTLDPLGQGGSTPVLGHFMKLLVVTLIISLDGHIVMIEALNASVSLVPVGAGLAMVEGVHALLLLAGEMFVLGVRLAAPVTAAVLVGNVALGVLARATPQLNIFMVAYPVQIGIGLITLGLGLPLIGAGLANWPDEYATTVLRLLDVLGGPRS